MSPSVVGRIVKETCESLCTVLKEKGLKECPSDESSWKDVPREFKEKWHFPNYLGTLDGKHVMMQAPHNSGSSFFNYKNFFSIVLLGICDAKYRFIIVDIGDSGVYTTAVSWGLPLRIIHSKCRPLLRSKNQQCCLTCLMQIMLIV